MIIFVFFYQRKKKEKTQTAIGYILKPYERHRDLERRSLLSSNSVQACDFLHFFFSCVFPLPKGFLAQRSQADDVNA